MARHRTQRGVAIITALVIVAAATVSVAAMMWRESIAVRKVENQAALGEARWLARSAIEWARLVLLQDARTSSVDHLGEFWALPLAETRVTDDLATPQATDGFSPAFVDNDAAFVSGGIRDAQARINLTGLVTRDQVDDERLAVLTRLAKTLALDEDLPKKVAAQLAVSSPVTFDDLAASMTGAGTMRREDADRLRPYVAILPSATPVNLNTAPAEVLAAVFTDLPLDAARALIRSRDQAWFNQVTDATARLPGTGGQGQPGNVSVSSHWFEVSGRVRVGRADLDVAALVERDQSGVTRVRSLVER